MFLYYFSQFWRLNSGAQARYTVVNLGLSQPLTAEDIGPPLHLRPSLL